MTARLGVLTASRSVLPPRFAAVALLWLVVIVLLTGYAFRRSSAFLRDADAMDTAQLARQIALGHGFSTIVLRPLALTGWTRAQGTGKNVSASDVSHAPLFPLGLAVAFAAHGGHGGANLVVAFALLGFLLGAAGVGHLARTLFSADLWPIPLSVGLYALGTGILTDAARGGPSGFAAFAVCESLILLLRARVVDARPSHALAAGVGLGLCFLIQYSLILLLPLALVLVFVRRGWSGVGLCTMGFFLVTGVWLVRTALVTHSGPFFDLRLYGLMADTPDFPGASSIYRSAAPASGLLAFFFSHPAEMLSKVARGLSAYSVHASDVVNVVVLAPALASLFARPPDDNIGSVRVFVALAALGLVGVTAFFEPSVGTLLPLAAPVCVLAAGWVFLTLRQQLWSTLGQRVGIWIWAVLVWTGVLSMVALLPPDRSDPLAAGIGLLLSPSLPPPADVQAAQIMANGAVLTDAPAAVAWRTGLPAVWLPRDNAAYEAVVAGRGAGSVDAPSLLLTPALNTYSVDDMTNWTTLAQHPQAWRTRQQALQDVQRLPARFEQKVEQVQRLAASGKISISPAEIARQAATGRATLPAAIARQKQNVQAAFDADYGPIAEAVEDYAPVGQQPESNRQPSTLFLRATALPHLGIRVQPDAQ